MLITYQAGRRCSLSKAMNVDKSGGAELVKNGHKITTVSLFKLGCLVLQLLEAVKAI